MEGVPAGDILLAHITDTHVAPRGRRTAILKDRSVEILADLVDQVRAHDVDCTLFGGDNIENRDDLEEDIDAFARHAVTTGRFVCIVGNHEAESDETKARFAERMHGHGIAKGRYCFSEAVGNVRIIGIDTTRVGSGDGSVSPETMAFLSSEIGAAHEEHVVVLGHHLLHPAWEPHVLETWDCEYLVENRDAVVALLASSDKVRAYLCGHHHASRIQRIAGRGEASGFYHIVTASPVAYPHTARFLRFGETAIHVETFRPRIEGILEQGKAAVQSGRKASRFGALGTPENFLAYVRGRSSDNNVVLPYGIAPMVDRSTPTFERPRAS